MLSEFLRTISTECSYAIVVKQRCYIFFVINNEALMKITHTEESLWLFLVARSWVIWDGFNPLRIRSQKVSGNYV
jgi:hypothetical protein